MQLEPRSDSFWHWTKNWEYMFFSEVKETTGRCRDAFFNISEVRNRRIRIFSKKNPNDILRFLKLQEMFRFQNLLHNWDTRGNFLESFSSNELANRSRICSCWACGEPKKRKFSNVPKRKETSLDPGFRGLSELCTEMFFAPPGSQKTVWKRKSKN